MAITYYPAGARLKAYIDYETGLDVGITGPDDQGKFIVHYPPDATEEQKAQGDALATDWPPDTYQSRTLYAIRDDILALTPAQQDNIIADLWSGTPEKILLHQGSNCSPIFAVFFSLGNGAFAATPERLGRIYASALYVQERPVYLINPGFDPSINVPGWEPVPPTGTATTFDGWR